LEETVNGKKKKKIRRWNPTKKRLTPVRELLGGFKGVKYDLKETDRVKKWGKGKAAT